MDKELILLERKRLENEIFRLLTMGISGRGDAKRDIPTMRKLAKQLRELGV